MGDEQVEFVLSRLGKDVAKALVGEVLKLVDIEVKGRELFERMHRHVGSRHGSEIDLGHQHTTEQCRIDLTYSPFRKVNEEDLLLVHHFADVERRAWLTDDVADNRITRKLTDLVLNSGGGFLDIALRIASELFFPVALHLWVGDLFHHLLAKGFADEHAVNIE